MDTRAVKVFLGCALGGGVGSFVALQLAYFWWAGLLLGGAVGYMSYEFREVLRAVRIAAVFAWQEAVPIPPRIIVLLFRALTSRWFRVAMLRLGFGLLWPVALAASFTIVFLAMRSVTSLTDLDGTLRGVPSALGFVGVMVMMLVFSCTVTFPFVREKGKYLLETKTMGLLVLALSPVGLALLVAGLSLLAIFLPIAGIGFAILKRGTIGKFCWIFTKTLFRTIHSDIRLLCFVDAMIGAAIGFYLGNPVAGAAAGGVIGVVNYKIVSQRWLKLHLRAQNG